MENVENVDSLCHDCGQKLSINKGEIENGVFLIYDNNGEKINIIKCNNCYSKNPSLTNFQECEVYSRVVGYIRPVQQWHKGKKQEYGERKEFTNPSTCC